MDAAGKFLVDLEDLPYVAVLPVGGLRAGIFEFKAVPVEHRETARAALDGSQPIPAGSQTPVSQMHIRILLAQIPLGAADLDILVMQLTAALDGPLLLYLSASDLTEASRQIGERIAQGWQDLVRRVCRP